MSSISRDESEISVPLCCGDATLCLLSSVLASKSSFLWLTMQPQQSSWNHIPTWNRCWNVHTDLKKINNGWWILLLFSHLSCISRLSDNIRAPPCGCELGFYILSYISSLAYWQSKEYHWLALVPISMKFIFTTS